MLVKEARLVEINLKVILKEELSPIPAESFQEILINFR